MKDSDILSKSIILKAVGNAKRLEILHYINKKELSVSTLEEMVGLSQSALSQHLAVLRKAKVVKTRRSAQTIYYRVDNTVVKQILKILEL